MRYTLVYSSVLAASLLIGCGNSSSSNGGGSATDVTVERGAVYHALVTDASGQVAKDNGTSTYTFASTPTYPITVANSPLTFIDVDGDGKASEGDLRLTKELKSCGTNVTPISTYVSAKAPKCSTTEVANVEDELVTTLGVSKEELTKLPSNQSKDAIIASNATFVQLVTNDDVEDINVSSIKATSDTIKTYVTDDKATAKDIEKAVIEKTDSLTALTSEQATALQTTITKNPITSETPKITKDTEFNDVWEEDDTYRYSRNYTNSSNHFVYTDYEYNKSAKKWEERVSNNYHLKDGKWKQNNSATTDEGEASIDSNGVLTDSAIKIKFISVIDVEGSKPVDEDGDELDLNVTFPKGSKYQIVQSTELQDGYSVWGTASHATATLKTYIEEKCGTSAFDADLKNNIGLSFAGTKGNDGSYTCDTTATSGKLAEFTWDSNGSKVTNENAGTWEIKNVQGVDILITHVEDWSRYGRDSDDGDRIFAVRNDKVWQGEVWKKSTRNWYNYNKIAMEAIKEAVENKFK